MSDLPRLNMEFVQELINKHGKSIQDHKNSQSKKDAYGWTAGKPVAAGTRSCGVSEISGIYQGHTEMDILCAIADATMASKGLVTYYNNPRDKGIIKALENLGFGFTYFKNPVHGGAQIYRADLFIDNIKWPTLANMKPVHSAEAKTTSPATKTARRGASAATTTKNQPKRDRYGRFA